MSRADRVWSSLVTLVMDTRGDWRRQASEATGLPFGHLRALKRLTDRPLALHELAEAMGIDAPAATVAVNALERQGLVLRQVDPENRRAKRVSITAAGQERVKRLHEIRDSAPAAMKALSRAELERLASLVEKLEGE